jgi:hypothetical protein
MPDETTPPTSEQKLKAKQVAWEKRFLFDRAFGFTISILGFILQSPFALLLGAVYLFLAAMDVTISNRIEKKLNN